MKKIISAALAGLISVGALTACGDQDSEKDGKKSGGKLSDGRYACIYGIDGAFRRLALDDLDDAIEHGLDNAEDFYYIDIDGKSFEANVINNANQTFKYSGDYSIQSGKIDFEYKETRTYTDGEQDGDAISVDDDIPEYDAAIMAGTSPKLEGLSTDEIKQLKKEERAKVIQAFHIESMNNLNETGSFCKLIMPSANLSDKLKAYNVIPFVRWHMGLDLGKTETMTLKAVDDLICTDTYGIKLDGKYKPGKDFTLEYNMIDTVKNDEISPFNVEETGYGEEEMERLTESLSGQINSDDDYNTTFEFSDGEWSWYNAYDELINNGKYVESSDYPGLILMYIDEDSDNYSEVAAVCPQTLYFADDGNVYYPAFAMVD